MRFRITYLFIFLIACNQSYDSNQTNSDETDTVKLDSGYLINYYSSGIKNRIDSTYKFEYNFDTLINTQIVINSSTAYKISFQELTDSVNISIIEPKYEYLAILNSDTVIWGPNHTNTSITISKDEPILLDSFYVQNWGIISLADTIGAHGVQVNKLIKTHWKSADRN